MQHLRQIFMSYYTKLCVYHLCRSKNMKYVCSVRRDSTGMKLRMVMDGDNDRVLRQAVQRHFWAVSEWVSE